VLPLNRRNLLKLGLVASAGTAIPSQDQFAFGNDKPLPPAVGSSADLAARVTKLRGRRRHIGPPSPQLIKAFERIPRPVLVYDLSHIEENYLSFLEARKDVAVEPGRRIVATAAALSSRLLLRARRADGEWLHLDVGTYHGLSEALDRVIYPVTVAHRSGAEAPFTLCGPTCDSTETISKGQKLPNSVSEGDLFVFDIAGAYSECTFTHFNGIEPPVVRFLDDLLDL